MDHRIIFQMKQKLQPFLLSRKYHVFQILLEGNKKRKCNSYPLPQRVVTLLNSLNKQKDIPVLSSGHWIMSNCLLISNPELPKNRVELFASSRLENRTLLVLDHQGIEHFAFFTHFVSKTGTKGKTHSPLCITCLWMRPRRNSKIAQKQKSVHFNDFKHT